MKYNGMGTHESSNMKTDEWLTPPEIINALGIFDLDQCSPINRPWDTAKKHYNIKDDGLNKNWEGRVWCNPPYGKYTKIWLNKLAKHNKGTALIFARTETKMFFDEVWNKASSILFIEKRLCFYDVNGNRAKANAGAPSCLIGYGEYDSIILKNSGIKGKFFYI